MMWNRPQHLSDAEAEQWVRGHVKQLAALAEVETVSLTQAACPRRCGRRWDWVCELQLSADAIGCTLVDGPDCTEWLRELRLLGMHPSVAVLESTESSSQQ
jgi:hypothetical protein